MSPDLTPAWRDAIGRARAAGSGRPEEAYFQVATVGEGGRPAVRTVVFRGFLPDTDCLTFTTVSTIARN